MQTKKINRKNIISIALVLALLIVNIAFVSLLAPHAKIRGLIAGAGKSDCRNSSTKITDNDARVCFDGILSRDGAVKATQEFIKWNQQFNVDTQHSYAHVFGGLLYEHEGKVGLQYCTPDFAFGCYHQFLGKAIATEGLGVTKELNDGCFKYNKFSPLSCQHGIGHGVLAAVGYEDADMRKSLAVCKDLPRSDSIGGCYGGVFMEYNMRTMLGAHASIREMKSDGSKNDGHDVCMSLDPAYRNACYYWSPQWWAVSIGSRLAQGGDFVEAQKKTETRLAIATKLGEWCRQGPKENHEECFRGTGNIAGQEAGYEVKGTVEFCEAAAAKDEKSLLHCLEDAANSSATVPKYRATAKEICAPLSSGDKKECEERVDKVPVFMN